MSGEVSVIITMVAIGVALATFMFAMFRILDRHIEKLEATVQELVKDVAELKGAVNVIRDGLRIRVGESADAD